MEKCDILLLSNVSRWYFGFIDCPYTWRLYYFTSHTLRSHPLLPLSTTTTTTATTPTPTIATATATTAALPLPAHSGHGYFLLFLLLLILLSDLLPLATFFFFFFFPYTPHVRWAAFVVATGQLDNFLQLTSPVHYSRLFARYYLPASYSSFDPSPLDCPCRVATGQRKNRK